MRNDRYINENWDELSHKISWKELMFRINALRNSKSDGAEKLMHKLLDCSPEERCCSLACPICISIDREEYTRSIVELFADSPNTLFVTYIPYPILSSDKRIYDINFKFVKDKFRCYLKNSNITSCAVGCLEVDYDYETGMWIPHIHVISEQISKSKFKHMRGKINKKHIPARTDAKGRPLLKKKIYNLRKLCNYVYKFMWQNKPKKNNRNLMIDKTRIPHDLFIEYLVCIDGLTMQDLEFRYRLRRNKNGLYKIPRN